MDNQAWVGSKLSLPPVNVRVVDWELGRAERVQLDALIETEWEGTAGSVRC